ncbi:MAG: PAS domain-containing protein [Proteobacteria bacterium]|nr:PAS domain-containing protein [Pseudomonadota bacterium]
MMEETRQYETAVQRAILDALPAHIALVAPDGVILVVNEAWKRFGVANVLASADFLVGQNYLDVCDRSHGGCSDEAAEVATGIRRVLRGELHEFSLEYPCHSPLEHRWFRLIVTPLLADARAGAVVMHIDVTARRLALEETARTNRALQMLGRCNEALVRAGSERALLAEICRIVVEIGGYRMAWVGYPQHDESQTIVPQAHAGVEDGYLALLHLSMSVDEPGGQGPAGRAIHSGQPVIVPDLMLDDSFIWKEEARARGYAGVIVLPFKERDATLGLLVLYSSEARALPPDEVVLLQNLADNLAFGIGTLRAREDRRRQASLLDKARDAILVCGLDQRIEYWNKSAERLYGWSAEEALGRSARDLLYRDGAVALDAAISELEARGEWVGELGQVDKSGRKLVIEARKTLVRDEAGQSHVLAINTDITERRKLEQQFLRTQRMESIGTLAGGIAHDLNNMLTPIVMSIELLREGEKDKDRLDLLDTIASCSARGTDMVRQVLSFARGVEGRRIDVDVRHLLRDIAKIAHDTFPKNIEIRTQTSSDLWTVPGDPTQLHQVVLNLCVNARDAMSSGGHLTLAAENTSLDEHYAGLSPEARPGPHVCICIEDSGCGMTQEIVDKIFEPFFTTKEFGRGTGLGLSTSLAIVRSHAGFIRVYSEPGQGTRFKVYLPAQVRAGAEGGTPAPTAMVRGNGELILVADDEASVRQITCSTLEAFGYRVVVATDGAAAVALYAQRGAEIALVLTDMMMPIMDGPATILVLRRMNPQVRIIAVSGLTANGHVARAASAGAVHFLPKPYTAETLLLTIRQVLHG